MFVTLYVLLVGLAGLSASYAAVVPAIVFGVLAAMLVFRSELTKHSSPRRIPEG
jgi:hypothetical protein